MHDAVKGALGEARVADPSIALPAGRRLPHGMMEVHDYRGKSQLAYVASALAVLNVSKAASSDRMLRIRDAAKLAQTSGSVQSALDARLLVSTGTDCAVLYENTVYYGRVNRYGFLKPNGSVVEFEKTISLEPSSKIAGVHLWFAWYEQVRVVDGVAADHYRLSTRDLLQSGRVVFSPTWGDAATYAVREV